MAKPVELHSGIVNEFWMRDRVECTSLFFTPVTVSLSAASVAVRRLIGVTEVNKTGSSYGNVEAKKEN